MKTILLLMLSFMLTKTNAQYWQLHEDLDGFITDIEYDGDTRYVTFKSGELFRADTLLQTFDVQTVNETGLHSVGIWDGRICVYLSSPDSTQRLICGQDTLLEVSYKSPWSNRHRAGDMLLYPGNILLVSVGYGADPQDSQDPESPRGKIVAISDSTSKIFTSGVRNVWKMDLSGDTVYLADNGKDLQEEISIIDFAGLNLGWPCVEGNYVHDTLCADTNMFDAPLFTYNHGSGGNSIIGGKIFHNKYWFCDHYQGWGGKLQVDGTIDTIPCPAFPVGMAVHGDTIFVYDYTGKIYRWTENILSIDTTEQVVPSGEAESERDQRLWVEEMIEYHGDIHYSLDGHLFKQCPDYPGMYYSRWRKAWAIVAQDGSVIYGKPRK